MTDGLIVVRDSQLYLKSDVSCLSLQTEASCRVESISDEERVWGGGWNLRAGLCQGGQQGWRRHLGGVAPLQTGVGQAKTQQQSLNEKYLTIWKSVFIIFAWRKNVIYSNTAVKLILPVNICFPWCKKLISDEICWDMEFPITLGIQTDSALTGHSVLFSPFVSFHSIPLCTLINQHLSALARKFPQTKFLKSISTTCIPNYPDRNLPTIFVYFEGEMKAQFIGPLVFGGMNLKVEGERKHAQLKCLANFCESVYCFKTWILIHLLHFYQILWVKGFMTWPVSVSPRAGVEIIREWGGEDRSGGKPQEANWRQADVIHQMFASYTKGQWLWGRGRLEKNKSLSLQTLKILWLLHWKDSGRWNMWWCVV